MAQLLKKNAINEKSAKVLSDLLEGSCGELVQNQFKNMGKKKKDSDTTKEFALLSSLLLIISKSV
jgi:hypothetical protein